MFATAPGKLILTGEYAVLDGAPAIVVAVDRRAIARRGTAPATSPFLLAIAEELAAADPAAAEVARHVTVDTSALYAGERKLGLGSSAAATVAATACAGVAPERIYPVALAAHARAQGVRGARGSGADIAAAVHGGTIAFEAGAVRRLRWPAAELLLVPFSTGIAADTATLVARVMAVRTPDVTAALAAIADASRAAEAALDVQAFARAGAAIDQLARATAIDLVPACVVAARHALARLGGTAKTTGAGGGDVGVAVLPATVDATEVGRLLIEVGCQPLRLSVDPTGVDTRPAP